MATVTAVLPWEKKRIGMDSLCQLSVFPAHVCAEFGLPGVWSTRVHTFRDQTSPCAGASERSFLAAKIQSMTFGCQGLMGRATLSDLSGELHWQVVWIKCRDRM